MKKVLTIAALVLGWPFVIVLSALVHAACGAYETAVAVWHSITWEWRQ